MKLGLATGADPEKTPTSDNQDAAPTNATPPGGFVPPEPAVLGEQFPQLEVLELLGQGGMGAVYKARQKHLDRLVALKILLPEVGKDPAFAERFAREARSLAKLSHPHIVTLYEFGHSDDGLYYFIMEFVDGTDLRHIIQKADLAPEEALVIVPQICEALQFAHEEGIVHRDIKPENILLDKRGRVKIGDFGLAKLLDKPPTAYTLTADGHRMGTPHYMAPEQIEHPHQVDHRADIFSLGVVFYEMLTGELPIGRFAPPSQKVHVDVRIDNVVLRSLEKEPERRYQHASEIKTEVEAIGAADMPDVATGPSPAPGDQTVWNRDRRARPPSVNHPNRLGLHRTIWRGGRSCHICWPTLNLGFGRGKPLNSWHPDSGAHGDPFWPRHYRWHRAFETKTLGPDFRALYGCPGFDCCSYWNRDRHLYDLDPDEKRDRPVVYARCRQRRCRSATRMGPGDWPDGRCRCNSRRIRYHHAIYS